jgi:nucleotide-binding universal stress UspA family protein
MYDIRRVLVALDLTEIDDALIRYARVLSKALSLDKIYFITVVKKLDLPDEITAQYPDLLAPVDESITERIRDRIEKIMGSEMSIPYDIDVLEGDITSQVLHWAKVKETDLIAVGKKTGSTNKGINGDKIARLSPCHVAFVPKRLPESISKVLVPIDFSDSSQLAVQLAVKISAQNEGSTVQCIHVYHVPSGYHVSGKSYEEFAEIMKNTAMKLYKQFISSIEDKGTEVKCEFVLGSHENIAKIVYSYAGKSDAAGIVIGSKGKTKVASMLLGSTTEKFIHQNAGHPLIVAKPKNKILDIFDAMLSN